LTFCTLFDSNYLSRGLTLYRSLETVCKNFHLYIFAFDDRCYRILRQLNLAHATIISLKEFEDTELLTVKPSRSRAEYCWTSTSSTILYVLEHFPVTMCTYLDADMMFFSSPEPLFEEMGNASVTITEHRYTPRYDKSRESGKYCVQFVSIRSNEQGLRILRWWRDRCLEWCYARIEEGKFGDQKYLDDWTTRFESVHVLQHLGGGVAAWNVQQYEVFDHKGKVFGKKYGTDNQFPVVFYHFHYVRFLENDLVELGRRMLTTEVIRLLYIPYLKSLDNSQKEIAFLDPSFDAHGSSKNLWTWKTPILYLYRKILGIYHIYPRKRFYE